MKATKVNKVNQGTYFKLQDTETAPVWVRGEYIREAGKYSCFKFDDTNHEKLMKTILWTKKVYGYQRKTFGLVVKERNGKQVGEL